MNKKAAAFLVISLIVLVVCFQDNFAELIKSSGLLLSPRSMAHEHLIFYCPDFDSFEIEFYCGKQHYSYIEKSKEINLLMKGHLLESFERVNNTAPDSKQKRLYSICFRKNDSKDPEQRVYVCTVKFDGQKRTVHNNFSSIFNGSGTTPELMHFGGPFMLNERFSLFIRTVLENQLKDNRELDAETKALLQDFLENRGHF